MVKRRINEKDISSALLHYDESKRTAPHHPPVASWLAAGPRTTGYRRSTANAHVFSPSSQWLSPRRGVASSLPGSRDSSEEKTPTDRRRKTIRPELGPPLPLSIPSGNSRVRFSLTNLTLGRVMKLSQLKTEKF
ncbi:hypothetical protein AVEN_105959-1 [Araneus ventricosus]|uniref:Uncharacterized protein n=1 Tax=Araneus ventricosus TaxID=182803 RepID=A0A4Y2DWK3_ARAVE|nr:hypothetical protein AVEN_105959-1 [Araneus ventricosus]